MIVAYIVAIVVLFLIIILFVPLHLVFEYRNNLKISLKFFSAEFKIYENFKNENSDFSSLKTKSKNSSDKHSQFKVKENFKKIFKLFSISKDMIIKILKYIKINSLMFCLKVSGKDSFSTAIKYGNACTLIYPVLEYIYYSKHPETYNVLVCPSFTSEKDSFYLKLEISSNLFYLVFNTLLYARKFANLLKN